MNSASPAAAVNGAADPSPSLADAHVLLGSANGHESESAATRPRCAVPPPPDREACRYPAKAGTDRCTLHVEYPGRRVDVTRWCAAWRPVLNAPCQSYVVPGARFCLEHNGKPSTRMAPTERQATALTPSSNNGHHPPPDHSPTHRPRLPAAERQARATVIAAMGNNPAAILVTIGILVETGSGPLSWSTLAGAARREGLLAPPAAPSLAGMLLGAVGPR